MQTKSGRLAAAAIIFLGFKKEGANHAWNNIACRFDTRASGRAAAMAA
jgi:hypothetical protein